MVYITSIKLKKSRFNLSGGGLITNRSPGFNSDSSIREEMHCVVLVLDATRIPKKGSPLHKKMLELKEQIDARGNTFLLQFLEAPFICFFYNADEGLRLRVEAAGSFYRYLFLHSYVFK